MSGWEERMAERAAAREAERAKAELAAWERQELRDEEAARQSPEFLAGPPGGCAECYVWVRDKLRPTEWFWTHRAEKLPGHPWSCECEQHLCGCEQHLCGHDCHPVDDRPWMGAITLA